MGKMVSSSPSAEESLDALESTVNALVTATTTSSSIHLLTQHAVIADGKYPQ